jgi:hypothetical protein
MFDIFNYSKDDSDVSVWERKTVPPGKKYSDSETNSEESDSTYENCNLS